MSLESSVETIINELEEVKKDVQDIKKRVPAPKYLYISDLPTIIDFSESYIVRNPWTQPNFGMSDRPGRRKKGWLIETVEAWYKVPLRIRKQEWKNMSEKDRQRYRGAA